MQTDYAQILPIILPVPKAGPNAPVNVVGADGKTTSPTRAEAADLEALASEDGSDDLSQSPSAFDQALAQMMMVQVPVAQTLPQAPAQQGLGTNPIDITAALDALQPGSGLGLAPVMDAGSGLTAPPVTPPAPSDLLPDPSLQVAAQAGNAPQTLPADPALAISTGAPSNAPITQAANFAGSSLEAASASSSDLAQTFPAKSDAAGLAVPTPVEAPQVQTKPIDLGLSTPQAPTSQVQPSATQDAQANATADTTPNAPSVSTPAQATSDRQSQAAILQAMGDAKADATARLTGMSVPQPLSTPNQTALTAPEPDQAQTAPSTLMQAQSAAPAQATLQTAAQAMSSAQTGARETAQANSRVTTPTLAPSETTSTSAPSVASPLTAIAITANGGANSADTGGAFQEAPSDFAEAAAAQTMPMEGEASTDIFGAPLPLEGRVTQASLQGGSSATLSTPATAPHLAAEISRKFEGKSAQFDISLTPEGLGKVDVKITINARGEVSAAMKFDNPQAAAELKGRAAELQRALEQSGFSLSQDGISFSDGQGQGFGAAQQQASQQDWQETARRTAQNRLFQDSNDLADAAALRVAEASSAYSRRSNTGVDVRI